jgi:hypothetical protein
MWRITIERSYVLVFPNHFINGKEHKMTINRISGGLRERISLSAEDVRFIRLGTATFQAKAACPQAMNLSR